MPGNSANDSIQTDGNPMVADNNLHKNLIPNRLLALFEWLVHAQSTQVILIHDFFPSTGSNLIAIKIE